MIYSFLLDIAELLITLSAGSNEGERKTFIGNVYLIRNGIMKKIN